MTYHCPTCDLEIRRDNEHPTLVHCVQALVAYVREMDKDLASDIRDLDREITNAQNTADEAKDLAYGLETRIEEIA